ncbi:MAG: DNA repair protein [Bacteroidetes bacterium]|nr:DNA repair protein [Bacteroidota bacterium]
MNRRKVIKQRVFSSLSKGKLRRKRKNKLTMGEVSIVYRRPLSKIPGIVKSSNDAYRIFKNIFESERIDYKEFFFVLLMSNSNRCLCYSRIGEGNTSGTVVNIKEILQLVLKTNACGVILAHNHPSGNLTASEADIRITRKIRDSCESLEIVLLDHIIISSESYFSFMDEGLI